MDILELMKARHSVRQYTPQAIEPEKRAALDALTAQLNAEFGLNIQVLYDEPKCFDSFMAHYGKFSGVKNYIALVGPKGPMLDEQLGYCGEQLALKAQELGLNTCWVAMTHGKSAARLRKGDKAGCILSLGYGETQGVAHTSKAAEAVSRGENAPDWFRIGVEAALLAPTAMNQQKFFFTYQPDGTVKATTKGGFYTKVDLGIAKYHFEAVSGHKLG